MLESIFCVDFEYQDSKLRRLYGSKEETKTVIQFAPLDIIKIAVFQADHIQWKKIPIDQMMIKESTDGLPTQALCVAQRISKKHDVTKNPNRNFNTSFFCSKKEADQDVAHLTSTNSDFPEGYLEVRAFHASQLNWKPVTLPL